MSRVLFFINHCLFLAVVLSKYSYTLLIGTCRHLKFVHPILILQNFLKFYSAWQPFAAAEADYFNVIEKLHVNLLKSYNNQIRPVINHTDALNVELSMRLTSFNFVSLL